MQSFYYTVYLCSTTQVHVRCTLMYQIHLQVKVLYNVYNYAL